MAKGVKQTSSADSLRGWHVASPVGRWLIVATDTENPTVVAISLATDDAALSRLTADELNRYRGISRIPNAAVTGVREYFDGDLQALDRIAVEQPGSPFLQRVWRNMRRIRAGHSWSYGQLAEQAGSANAVRATGSACARNRIPLIVPCHRVVRTDGNLGNYYYGIDVKQRLLEHEGYQRS